MLAQVLWRQVVYQREHNGLNTYAKIPQGTVVFVATNPENSRVKIIFNDIVLRIPSKALHILKSDQDLIPSAALELLYHNKRSAIREV